VKERKNVALSFPETRNTSKRAAWETRTRQRTPQRRADLRRARVGYIYDDGVAYVIHVFNDKTCGRHRKNTRGQFKGGEEGRISKRTGSVRRKWREQRVGPATSQLSGQILVHRSQFPLNEAQTMARVEEVKIPQTRARSAWIQ
jgi:hypothetical protein